MMVKKSIRIFPQNYALEDDLVLNLTHYIEDTRKVNRVIKRNIKNND